MTQSSRKDRQATRRAEKRNRAHATGAVAGVDAGKFEHGLVVRANGGIDSRPLKFPVNHEGFTQAEEFILRHANGATPNEILIGIEFAGVYGHTLAHYLHSRGFQVVSVPPAHTKAFASIAHGKRLKTDGKDAQSITMLVGDGHFQSFPFLEPAYAQLRHLVSARERQSLSRGATLTRLKSALQVTWPEFETVFKDVKTKSAIAVLRAFPGPQELLAAPKAKVMRVLKQASRNHLREDTYDALCEGARHTIGLAGGLAALKAEIALLLDEVDFHGEQIKKIEAAMVSTMASLPEAQALMTIPGVAPVAAAIFLGSVGDPQAYESSRQVLALAGLSLTEHSSGTRKGSVHISKQGRPLLRRLSFMLALRAIRADGIYRTEFEAMVQRMGGKKLPAVVAVGRRLLRLMFSVARSRRTYTPEPPNWQPQSAA
jgi:transposase